MAADPIRIESTDGAHPGQRIVRVSGQLILETELAFLEQVRRETAPALILDMSGVPWADSRGVAALTQILNTFKRENRRLALVAPTAKVQRVLEVAQVAPMFRIFANAQEAGDALA